LSTPITAAGIEPRIPFSGLTLGTEIFYGDRKMEIIPHRPGRRRKYI
jgi:hypothetical protein